MNVRYEHPVRTRCERDYRDAVDGSYPNLTTARVLPCRPVRRDDALPAGNTPSRKDGGRTACSKRCPASDIFQAGCGIVSRGPGQLDSLTELIGLRLSQVFLRSNLRFVAPCVDGLFGDAEAALQ
jgi:hypothetical protein